MQPKSHLETKLVNYLNNYSSYSTGLCLHFLGTVFFRLEYPAPTHWEDLEFTFPVLSLMHSPDFYLQCGLDSGLTEVICFSPRPSP